MKTEILNKLSKEDRDKVIAMEARLRQLDESLAEIEFIEQALDGKHQDGLL